MSAQSARSSTSSSSTPWGDAVARVSLGGFMHTDMFLELDPACPLLALLALFLLLLVDLDEVLREDPNLARVLQPVASPPVIILLAHLPPHAPTVRTEQRISGAKCLSQSGRARRWSRPSQSRGRRPRLPRTLTWRSPSPNPPAAVCGQHAANLSTDSMAEGCEGLGWLRAGCQMGSRRRC